MRSRAKSSRRTILTLESLDGREVPATLAPIADFTTPNTKAFYVPLTVSNANGTVTFNATSSNSQVTATVVQGGTTIQMNVTGTDNQGAAFQGTLTFRLFDSLAPVTTARIVSLVNSHFYDGLTFHRIIDNFVAQGGDPQGNGTGGSGTKLNDEFNTLLTFNSPGLLAMAKGGDDTGDSQFFVTDIDVAPLQQPQNLNFNHTIFGQLVAGFDTFTKIIQTPTDPTNDRPTHPVTITSATVVQSDPNGVLRITAPPTFTGTSTITVTPSDTGGAGTGDNFDVTFAADTVNDPPFLGPIGDQTTGVNTPKTFTLTSTDLENNTVTYSVTATSGGQTINVNPQINQATGQVTVTPPAGFVGAIDLTVGVRDTGTTPADTQVIKLNVTGGFDLATASDDGVLTDDNVTGVASPTVNVFAPHGQTVAVSLNGTSLGNATETSTSGKFQITIPAGRLQAGTNTLTGTATPSGGTATQLPAFTLTFAPSLREAYIVPGAAGGAQQVTFELNARLAAFRNEFGVFKADDSSGTVGGLSPGDSGYAAAALARRQVIFSSTATAGTSNTVTANGGDVLVPYIVQNSTSANLLAVNSSNARTGSTVAFFGFAAANPDGIAHAAAADQPGASQVTYGWEDLTGGGDRDYNDVVVSVRLASASAVPGLVVPGGAGRSVPLTAVLGAASRAVGGTGSPRAGEIGVIAADDATGRIGTLHPGDPGYAAAALARAQILFAPGTATGQNSSLNLTGGQSLFFYFVPGGTAAQVAAGNPTNNPSNGTVAFFSIPAANADGGVHTSLFNPEQVSQAIPTLTDPFGFHLMGTLNGTPSSFDDAAFSVRFGS